MATAVGKKKSAKKATKAAPKVSVKTAANASAVPAYKNASLPAARRTADLLRRMTLEEKAAQMLCIWQEKAQSLVNEKGEFDLEKAKQSLRGKYALARGLGQVGRPSDAGGGRTARQMAELTNAIQKFFLEHSRLGIPVIFHEECLHGHAAPEGTSFPQPIALAGTWNPELVERLFTMTALEARSRGAHHALTPVVDVAREPRWGRVEETYGEDPYLVSRMGIAAVKGFQGDATFKDKTRVLATLKHFVGHGQPESGMNCAPANVSERVVRETFLYTFREALREAGAVTLMASYNEIDGVPSHASKWLLRDVLRKQWGFKGFVVSDYYAIWELGYRPDTHGHFVAKDRRESAKLAVEAGVSIELPDPDCYKSLVELVKKGLLKERQLDEMVAPMLYWKFVLGLFDDPYVDEKLAEKVVRKTAHRDLALRAARESITLLKNDGGLAPLDLSKVKTIAVIGPNAHRGLLGGYSGVPLHNVTVLDGIRRKAAGHAKVLYSEGCKITIGGSWNQDAVTPSDPEEDRRQIAEAVEVAKKADVIVLAIGGNEQTSREAWNLQHMGDRTSLDLIGRQNELVDAMAALGKPVIAFLFNGRPLSPPNLIAKVPVIFECWYLGQETGRAVADALFGDFNPGGKLPISFPRSAGHLPVFYNYKPSARRGYLFDDVSPLFAFGYGLSYTTFSLANARIAKKKLKMGESTTVSVDVTNTGTRAGTETVQLYIRDVVSSVTRPVKELKGFRKLHLEPGETRTVTLPVTPESLKFWDVKMKYVVEPGEFRVMVGTSSRDEDLMNLTLTVA
ncbi:MAG TPA: glycoside hydrolase family 3 N-terminal domain-containing protein [Acidobacteriaceae bacterium]|nr:glycoside hydrolase family 3 N-terminal domain-containing protein [Acidobacteriaceae bacterium]